jgi:hypothetical protein
VDGAPAQPAGFAPLTLRYGEPASAATDVQRPLTGE